MGLESINQDQYEAFVQVLKKRLTELDQELRLPSHKRRLDREIEFDKRLIVQSLNAIQKYKNQGEIRIGQISNNLFGRETLDLFAKFQEELEKQRQTQPGIEPASNAQASAQAGPVVEAMPEPPPAPRPAPVEKEKPHVQLPEQPAKSKEDLDVIKEKVTGATAAVPEQAAGVKTSPAETPIHTAPTKLPEVVVETPIPPVQEAKEPVETVSSIPETAASRLEETPGDLTGGPAALAEPEPPVVTIPTILTEPVVEEQEAPIPLQPSIISQAPFSMPVTEHEIPVEEPAAMAEEPGVPWNGTLRVGNIFKGQKASYQLEKCLGTGKYGEAWKAVVVESSQEEIPGKSVVLKISSPGLTIEEKQTFEAETSILDQLRDLKPENLIRLDGKLLVPEVLEFVQDPDIPPQRSYFTQSLAEGQPIDELRRKKAYLPEAEALEITAQICRVLQALHEGLQMSLLSFQPENILWNDAERRISVIDWKHLSKPEQANFAGDVISAASELYGMLMGVPTPLPGSQRSLAEPIEQWNELSQGAKDILMRAFDPFRPYQAANELRKDLEWLGEWWGRPANQSMGQFKNLLNQLPQDEKLFEQKHEEVLEKTLWAGGVLDKLAAMPGNDTQLWVLEFHDLKSQLDHWKTGTYWLEKGEKSYQARIWDLAEQEFSQALKDTKQVLGATRWLQATKAARSQASDEKAMHELDVAQVAEAMNFLQQGNFAEAVPLFEQLATEPAQQGFEVLATEARLQANLQRVPGLLEGRQYRQLAEVYQNAIEWLGKLPQGYQDILKPGFEDFKQKQREYASQYKKIQKLQERLDQLKAAHKGEFSEYYVKLKELLDHQPGNIELLKRGKESIYEFLAQGKYAEGRTLAALCLDYSCGADPYLVQVWQYACQLERCWQAWSRGNGPAFRNALLNQAWPSELWATLVERILDKTLELPEEYFVAEFLDEIITSAKITYENPNLREQINLEKTRLLKKIDEALQADEDDGTELLTKLMQTHPYSLTLFNVAAAKVDTMLQNNNFSAALKIAQTAVSQFSILDLRGNSEEVAQVLNLFRSFLNSAKRILPLQKYWLDEGAAGLAQQLELEDPWGKGTRWGDDELDFLRDFLASCLDKLTNDFLGWNLVFSKVDKRDGLYQRLAVKREVLNQEFKDDTNKRLQADPQAGLENLRRLWVKYPLDPILEQVSLEVLDHEFLFKDENAQKAHKILKRLSGFPEALKERIELSVKNAQFYQIHPDNPETTYQELSDILSGTEKSGQSTQEKTAFLQAVRHSWFNQALENEDLSAMQQGLALVPKDKWTRTEVEALSNLTKMYFQKVRSLADSTNEALKKGEQLEQQPVGLAAKLMKNLQKQPGLEEALLEWNNLIDNLRIWIEKTRQAGWNEESFRLESYLEKITKLYARVELLTERKVNETNLVLIGELWKLALPGTPEDPQGDPKETPKASEENRRQWLLQMDKACQELIKTFPKDSQKQVWTGWQSRIQAELRKIQKP